MIQGEEFPVLTRSRRVPAQVLEFLHGIDTAAARRSRLSGRAATALDELTMQTLPEIIERALGPDHPEFAKALHRLAVHYHAANNIEKAEFLYRRALDTGERAFPEPNQEFGLLLNNLGRLLHDQRKWAEAERLYQKALGILQEALTPEHPKLSTPLANLATLYWDQGKQELAQNLSEDSLAILIKAHGAHHPKVLKLKARFAKHRNRPSIH